MKQLYLRSILLINNLSINKTYFINTSHLNSLNNIQLIDYEKNIFDKKIMNNYNNQEINLKNYNFTKKFINKNFYVNKKHKQGKLINNKFFNLNITKNNKDIKNKLNFIFSLISYYKRFYFNSLHLTNNKYFNFINNLSINSIFLNKHNVPLNLISFSNINTLTSFNYLYEQN